MVEQFLGIKNSTRELSDIDFEKIISHLATELTSVDYKTTYSDKVLYKEWDNLLEFSNRTNISSSSVRTGIKLCEHFFPNFYDIENKNGISFSSLWSQPSVLEKVLRWNRKSHSTPYLSELKRGIYFTQGLTKNTMFRPHLAKMVCDMSDTETVLDPCCGWGGRLLGAVASGKHYVGFDPNPITYDNLKRLVKSLGIENKVTLINDGAENMDKYDFPEVGLVLTSPPYFNLEIYHNGNQQSENQHDSYEQWKTLWLRKVISLSLDRLNGYSCWNVHNVGKMKMIDDVKQIHEELGYEEHTRYSLQSSPRQSNKTKETAKKKNSDLTICYRIKK